jgi:hypothetical protein
MRVFAIGDLHLPSLRDKSMQKFGWTDHPAPLAAAWDALVKPDDLVLLVGDLSWATRSEEAVPDFQWIEARPGKKVLVKGNHDLWWADSLSKLKAFLAPFPSVIGQLHASKTTGSAFQYGRVVLAGTRGWSVPEAPAFSGPNEMGDEVPRPDLIDREASRLAGSIAAADALVKATPGAVKLLAMHFPPLYVNEKDTVFSRQIEAWKPEVCVYGHLHSTGIGVGFVGTHGGVPYRLLSCDAARFVPQLIWEG